MCSMGVMRRVCSGRRSVRKLVAWAVLLGGFCGLSLNYIHVITFAPPPEDGKKEGREMMDGNDDGKMMGRADNEGESEIEINEKRKNEEQKVRSHEREDDDDNDDRGRKQVEYDYDFHNIDMMSDKHHVRYANVEGDDDDDSDAKTDDVEEDGDKGTSNVNENAKNNSDLGEQKIEIIKKENESNDLETLDGETEIIEDKQAQEKGEEEEKEESKQGRNLLVMELKPDLDKPLDKPKIEQKNTPKSKNKSASEENRGEGEEENEVEEQVRKEGKEEQERKEEKEYENYVKEEEQERKEEKEGKENEVKEEQERKEKEDENDVKEEQERKEEKEDEKEVKEEQERKDEKEVKEEQERKEEQEERGGMYVPWESPVALSGNYAPNESLDGRPVVKVLLLAYQRSGSSFTGELLSSGDGSMYVYEPLYPWRQHVESHADPAMKEDAAKLLGDLLDCSPEVISMSWRMWPKFFKRRSEGVMDFCKAASFRLLKTIRARASFMLPWLQLRQDIKVVHLVRDPRGIVNSVDHGGSIWTNKNRDPVYQCNNIESDLSLEQLGPQRYLRVRYEDLIEKPQEETMRIFSFMGVPLDSSVMNFLKQHVGVAPSQGRIKHKYMSTYRNSEFNPEHWRNELDKRTMEQIQDACLEVLSLLQYPIFPSST